MVKIEVEIKDNKLFYKYSCGEENHQGCEDITSDGFIVYLKLIEHLHSFWISEDKKKMGELKARLVLEKLGYKVEKL